MQRFLDKEGLRMVAAMGGAEGIQLAQVWRPAAITLDVMMPGMDGWAVLTTLKADPDLADIPVIMLTVVDNKPMGYALGAADYFSKSIDWERLFERFIQIPMCFPPCPVLVVEDDDNTRDMLRRTLQKEGWLVTEATNGYAALTRVAENRPELIVLDLMMPGMDGFAFLEALMPRHLAVDPCAGAYGQGPHPGRPSAPRWLCGTTLPEGRIQSGGTAQEITAW